jgi:alpha-D-ribose 1-methylphosphonate 5-triphosphate synthase subunit PhnG
MSEIADRQQRMGVLARATCAQLEDLIGPNLPAHEMLKPPETGTVMIEGRAGGAGRRFNLGEATVTRCVIRLATGAMGFSYALGRDLRKARMAAILDAKLQRDPPDSELHQRLANLASQQASTRDTASRKAAATKVDFFTLVRGA